MSFDLFCLTPIGTIRRGHVVPAGNAAKLWRGPPTLRPAGSDVSRNRQVSEAGLGGSILQVLMPNRR